MKNPSVTLLLFFSFVMWHKPEVFNNTQYKNDVDANAEYYSNCTDRTIYLM